MNNYIEIFRHVSDKDIIYNNYVMCRTEIPTHNNKTIDWTKTVGLIFDFSYQGFNGYLTVLDYYPSDTTNTKLGFAINGSDIIYYITIKAFKKVGFKEIVKIRYYDYNIGDIVKNKEIIEISHKGKSIIYKYKCLNDGYIGCTTQSNIKRNSGYCPVCTNCAIIEGVNDIPTTDPWMIPYFKGGYNEAKLYRANSKEFIEAQCPHCGKYKKIKIIDIHQHKGFTCDCSDKIPYPEKCMINLLDILNIDYKYQCGNINFAWLNSKYHYDFYIPYYDAIIETNGGQHYKEVPTWIGLNKVQKNDLYKKDVAISNGVKHYIELDCSESNIDKFKKSVMDSILPSILCFKERDIDWNKIDELSTRNITKEICLYKEEHPYLTPQEIANNFGITKNGINKHYKIGEKFGWCTYNKEQIRWVSHFHRNTHYLINGHYFYNVEDITARSFDIFGEKILGLSVATYIRQSKGDKLFNKKYDVKQVSHKEYLIKNDSYPSYISEEIIDGLLLKYS